MPSTADPSAFITDPEGGALLLRGMNVAGSAKWSPDHLPHITEEDVRRLSRDFGFNFVRYLIFWEAVEPESGVFDEAYLDAVEERLDWFAAEGIWVLIDMHQDVYARRFCCDGAPEWAIRDDGQPFERQDAWFLNYFQPAVERAFDNFWDHEGPHADLQEHYFAAWARVVERFRDHPAVIGYDLMNEPSPGSAFEYLDLDTTPRPNGEGARFDQEVLGPFYQRLIERIREVDQEGWIFYEPRFGGPANGAMTHLPILTDPREGTPHLVWAPHLYSLSLEATGNYREGDPTVGLWEERRAEERAAQACPWVAGEWGLDQNSENADRHILDVVEMADRNLSGWSYWSYDEDGWNIWDAASGSERPNADLLVRPYPRRTAGLPTEITFDHESRVFTFAFESHEGIGGATQIYVPARRHYPEGYALELERPEDLLEERWDPDREILELVLDPAQPRHRLTIRPAP